MTVNQLIEMLLELKAEGHGDAVMVVGEPGLDTVPTSAYKFDNNVHIN